jgi:hypothetical protein
LQSFEEEHDAAVTCIMQLVAGGFLALVGFARF